MEQFTVRVSRWLLATQSLAPAERGRLLTALLRYAAEQEPQNLCGREKSVFEEIAKDIDRERLCENAQILCKNAHIEKENINSLSDSPSEEGIKNTTELTSEDMFEIFWKRYNVKVNKKRCVILWRKIKPDYKLLQTMLNAIAAWEHSSRWRNGYKPDPDTWLRNERWNDEVPEALKERKDRYGFGAYEQSPVRMEDLKDITVDFSEGT